MIFVSGPLNARKFPRPLDPNSSGLAPIIKSDVNATLGHIFQPSCECSNQERSLWMVSVSPILNCYHKKSNLSSQELLEEGRTGFR